MKKLSKKLLLSILTVALTFIALGTSTFAWFSMNNTVTVTGMEVSTKISDNLLIADDELTSTAKLADSYFANGLNQEVTGILEPVSTVNGTTFFYNSTDNAAGGGDAIDDVYIAYDRSSAAGKNAFDGNYGFPNDDDDEDCVGYVDYVFQLKAINSSDSAANLNVTRVNLLYNNTVAGTDTIKAFRVAIFVEDITSTDPAGAVGTLKTVLRQSGATYFSAPNNYAVSAVDAAPSTAVSQIDQQAVLASVAGNSTKYYKVVVRMWLEGEDSKCNNETFLPLTDKWTLDLAIVLGNGSTAVSYIGSVAGAVATATALVAKVTLSDSTTGTLTNGETPVSYQWYNASTNAAIDSATSYTYTGTDGLEVYCVITTARGSVYKTNTVTLTA